MAGQSAVPASIRNPTKLEREQGRRVVYARPPALGGAELVWLTAWGPYAPAAVDHRYQIIRVDSANAIVRCGATEHPVATGMVSVAPPGLPTRVARRDSAFSRVRAVLVTPALVRSVELDERRTVRSQRHSYLMRKDTPLRSGLDLLFASVRDGESHLMQQSALLSCVCAATHALRATDGGVSFLSMPERLRRAVDFLRDTYTEDVSLDELSSASGSDVHPRYLLSTFTRELGIAPHQYVLRLRVRRACDLLARGMSAVDAASKVGFYDAPQLHGHFVRLMGMTPGAYAKAVR